MQWQQVDDVNSASGNKNSSYVSGFNSYISSNPYRKLIIDDESNFDEEYEKHVTSKFKKMNNKQTNNRRPEMVTKEYPENDLPYETIKHRPGNSTYASVAKQGKKIAILSDSLCSGIKLDEFNHYIRKGFAYRKLFPGAKVKDLDHHCELTLSDDKPDACVINI